MPQNVAAFAAGLDRPADEVRLFLALREAASQRLFAHVPWLRQQLQDAVHAYARGITIDREAIERGITEAMSGMEGGLDPSNPESIQQLLGSGVLEPEETPEQQMALRRLETLLALVEGWVDTVVAEAAKDRLPGHSALAETMRRRRASGGPAEQTFATLVGLELRPRRLRDAATVWGAMTQQHGAEARDRLWSHPDLLPTSDDLDEPLDFVARQGMDDDWPSSPRVTPRSRHSRPTSRRTTRRTALASPRCRGRARRRVLPRVRGELDPSRNPARPLGPRVAGDQRPEALVVPGLEQVHQLVHEHVVDDVVGHRPQPAGQPDAAVGRRAGTPAPVLVVHPAHAGRLGQPVQVRGRQRPGPRHQLVVASERPAPALLAGLQLGDHLRHPATFLRRAERGGDEDDGAALLAIGGDRPAAPCAPTDLDDVAVGGRGCVGSRSGHPGTVSHSGDRAPLRRHPCGYTSHGRWT